MDIELHFRLFRVAVSILAFGVILHGALTDNKRQWRIGGLFALLAVVSLIITGI